MALGGPPLQQLPQRRVGGSVVLRLRRRRSQEWNRIGVRGIRENVVGAAPDTVSDELTLVRSAL